MCMELSLSLPPSLPVSVHITPHSMPSPPSLSQLHLLSFPPLLLLGYVSSLHTSVSLCSSTLDFHTELCRMGLRLLTDLQKKTSLHFLFPPSLLSWYTFLTLVPLLTLSSSSVSLLLLSLFSRPPHLPPAIRLTR